MTDAEADAAAAARREYEQLALEALEGVDLLLTPSSRSSLRPPTSTSSHGASG